MKRNLNILCVLLALGPATHLYADASAAVAITLRPAAAVQQTPVTLGDVLSFDAEAAEIEQAVASRPVLKELPAAGEVVVTHDQVAARLRELGVNMARVLLGGASACRVTIEPPGPQHASSAPRDFAASAPLLIEPADAPRTLADVIRRQVAAELAGLGGTPEIEFERGSQELLRLSEPTFSFTVRPIGRGLGTREFSVSLRRDGRLERTARVIAVVRIVRQVAVAARPLNQGAYVRPDDVRLEPRVFDQSHELGLGGASEVVGHQMATYVPAGQMLARKDVKQVDLVKRSQRVHVVSSGTGVRFRLTGMALDSGRAGDRVRVRLGESREERQIVTGVVTEFGTVSVGEAPAPRVASAEVVR